MDTIRSVIEWIQANPFLDFIILIAIPSIFEVSKIEINPWTWLGKKIGKVINGEVIDELKKTNKRLDQVEESQQKTEEQRLIDKANSVRTRIIRGADEIRMGTKHSKEYFDNLLEDITYYQNYCHEHPKYKNEKAVFAIRSIEDIYQKCLSENSFL